jgi:O-methyltransferase involved in polyketide biosynthesis
MFSVGYLKVQVFTHTLPDINNLKNAILQEIANVMQDTLRHVMASVPGRWQQSLYCHGGHLQDVVLKT